MSDSRVDFLGPGPFSLSVAQQATARSLGATVEATIYAQVGDDPHPRPISFQMTPNVADEFAVAILDAAAKCRK